MGGTVKRSKARKKRQAGDNEAREKQEADDKDARKEQQAGDKQERARQQTSDSEVVLEPKHIAVQVAAREAAADNTVRARSASVGEGAAMVSVAFAAGLFAMAAGGGIDAAATPDPNARRHAASTRQQRRQHNRPMQDSCRTRKAHHATTDAKNIHASRRQRPLTAYI